MGEGGNVPFRIDRDVPHQQRLLLSLLDNIPGMVYRGMPDWSITFVGSEVERLTGFSPGEILGKPMVWRGLIHPDDFRSVQETIRFCVRRRDPILRMEYRIVRKDGECRWINDRRQMIYDEEGRLLCVDGLCLDISDQKKAEQDLRAAFEGAEVERARTEAIIAGMGDGISIHSPDFVILYENKLLQELVGKREGCACHRFHGCLPRGGEECPIRKTFADGGVHTIETEAVTDRGSVSVEVTTSPIRGAGGDVISVVCIVRDISGRKREAQLEKQARTAQQMEAVGTLAGGIAHDFNNALTGIIGFADLLRMRLEKEPKLQRDVDEILKCAERASTLTRQLLAFARRQVIEPVSIGLNTVIRDLSRLMKKVSGESIEVRTRLTEEIPPIFADRGQLEQVLLNLCLNSRDAMPGGGEFLVATDAVVWEGERVEDHAVMPAGRYVLLSVADSGSGMDDATRKRAFEPYFTTKAPGKGTGLGLSMVYGIVKQNGGFIFLDTLPGRGTTFRVYFPASEAVSAAKEERKEAAVKGGEETVLLAEDEEAIRNLAERSLRGYGYEVLTARDGAEAVALFEAHPEIAIAVLDVVMPRLGGKEAFDAMRRARPDLKALFTSGYSTDRIHESFILLPGIEFLPKPYGPASLARRVREVLDKI